MISTIFIEEHSLDVQVFHAERKLLHLPNVNKLVLIILDERLSLSEWFYHGFLIANPHVKLQAKVVDVIVSEAYNLITLLIIELPRCHVRVGDIEAQYVLHVGILENVTNICTIGKSYTHYVDLKSKGWHLLEGLFEGFQSDIVTDTPATLNTNLFWGFNVGGNVEELAPILRKFLHELVSKDVEFHLKLFARVFKML